MILGRWKHPNIVRSRIEKDIQPAIGKLTLADVEPQHIDDMLKGVEGICNRHDYFEERKAARETWARLLAQLEKGDAEKVVPVRVVRGGVKFV